MTIRKNIETTDTTATYRLTAQELRTLADSMGTMDTVKVTMSKRAERQMSDHIVRKAKALGI